MAPVTSIHQPSRTGQRLPTSARRIACLILFGLLVRFGASFAVAQDAKPSELEKRGERIYRVQCQECHGADGKGDKEQDVAPLHGEITLEELTQKIIETMPEDEPEKCQGEDAKAVAEYVLRSFYESSDASGAARRPIVELSRLTVRQYRQAIADLGAEFLGASQPRRDGGLQGTYYDGRNFRKKVFTRVDPVVRFDFGKKSPDEKKIKPDAFSIRWRGSLVAPSTGEYEIAVRSKNGYRLWLNDPGRPLIDAWVRSGERNDRRATIYLVEGRAYPIRLELFKFQKKKYKEDLAAIELRWKPPHRPERVIPARWLSSNNVPPVLVVSTPFPPDDRSYGYERATRISPAWMRGATMAALEVAERISDHLPVFVGSNTEDRSALKKFGERFAETAFRRPLTDTERKEYIEQFVAKEIPPTDSVKRIVLAVLLSPRFLYRETGEDGWDDFDTASRLSFTLWDSLPPKWLRTWAADGKLSRPREVREAAKRLVSDRRAWFKVRAFLGFWLGLDRMHDITKDESQFPDFDELLVDDLRDSLDLALEKIIWKESGDFRELLRSDHWFATRRMIAFYGGEPVDNKARDDQFFWRRVPYADQAGGVLTHPLLLAGRAYRDASSPIHRGVFLARSVLGRRLKPPPVAVAPLAADLKPDLTTRERVALQTRPAACANCHSLINPLGFVLETFDAAGRFRTKERNKPIDASGWYEPVSGKRMVFNGPRDLALFLAESRETRYSLVKQLFHEFVKQPMLAFGEDLPELLTTQFEQNDCDIRRLMIDIAVVSARPGYGEKKE